VRRTPKLIAPFAEAWEMIVPSADGPHGPLPPLLLGLTVVTGLVDAFSYLVLGHVFVANMTGNVVFVGFALAGASGFSIPASFSALGAFSLGAVSGGRFGRRFGGHRGHLLAASCGLEALLVASSLTVAASVGRPGSGIDRFALIGLLCLAMGAQTAVVRDLAVPDLTTTVLTLTITGIFADGPLAGGARSKVGRRLLPPLAMFAGGLAGALLVLRVSRSLAIASALAILCLVAAVTGAVSRTDRPWFHMASKP